MIHVMQKYFATFSHNLLLLTYYVFLKYVHNACKKVATPE